MILIPELSFSIFTRVKTTKTEAWVQISFNNESWTTVKKVKKTKEIEKIAMNAFKVVPRKIEINGAEEN